MANGFPGRFRRQTGTATFISLDAGTTWKRVSNSSSIAEVTHDGNILVLAPENRFSRHISFSLDDGRSFRQIPISDDPLHIIDMISHPSENLVIIHGLQIVRNMTFGFVLPVNFTGFL